MTQRSLLTITPHPVRRVSGGSVGLGTKSAPAMPAVERNKDAKGPNVLLVDDQADVRRICRIAIQNEVETITEVGSGNDALIELSRNRYDLVLLDVDLPERNGDEVLRELRANPPVPNLKIIMLSGRANGDDLAGLLTNGADDFLTKPFSLVQLRARVKSALRLKEAQDRADVLTARNRAINAELELALTNKDGELLNARAAMVLALAKLVETRSQETGPHLFRLRKYSHILASATATRPGFAGLIDAEFIKLLEDASPLHDIGKAGIPDHIINKPGPLSSAERRQMQAHTVIGADTLAEVARKHPFGIGFFAMAEQIARHHHERWDGNGYPDRLAGISIPLSARIIAIGDVYDALRSKRCYKADQSHEEAVRVILEESPGHFDPALVEIFREVAPAFDAAYREIQE
ncbi:MAG: response regulator [Gemmataceae bacterium]